MIWRQLEIWVFVGLALLLHLAFFIGLPERGAQAAGAGGDEIVSLLGATEQIETMVAEWQKAPDIDITEPLDMPPPEAVDPVTPPVETAALPSLPQPQMPLPKTPQDALPQIQTPQAPPAPTQTALPTPPPEEPERQKRSEIDPETGQVLSSVRPRDRAKPPEDFLKRPQARRQQTAPSKPRKEKAKVADRAQKATQGRAAQKAAGSGGGSNAGAGTAAVSTGVSKAKAASLKKTWGAKIRNRIERSKRAPAGRRQAGKVTVALTVTRQGTLAGVSIARSSGNPAYDAAALQAVRRAGRFPAAPKALPGASHNFTVLMSFK